MDEIFIRSGNCKTMEYVGEERSLLLCAGQNRRGVFDGQNVDGRSIEKLAERLQILFSEQDEGDFSFFIAQIAVYLQAVDKHGVSRR